MFVKLQFKPKGYPVQCKSLQKDSDHQNWGSARPDVTLEGHILGIQLSIKKASPSTVMQKTTRHPIVNTCQLLPLDTMHSFFLIPSP